MGNSELHIGQIVRVIDGPFIGFRGEVKAVDGQADAAAKVAVQIYGRVASVGLAPHQFEAAQSN